MLLLACYLLLLVVGEARARASYVNGQRGSSQASLALHPLSVLVVVLADLRTWISHSTNSRNMLELGGRSRTSFTRVVDQLAARRPVFIPRPGRPPEDVLHVACADSNIIYSHFLLSTK